jgi:hypothetical protein
MKAADRKSLEYYWQCRRQARAPMPCEEVKGGNTQAGPERRAPLVASLTFADLCGLFETEGKEDLSIVLRASLTSGSVGRYVFAASLSGMAGGVMGGLV